MFTLLYEQRVELHRIVKQSAFRKSTEHIAASNAFDRSNIQFPALSNNRSLARHSAIAHSHFPRSQTTHKIFLVYLYLHAEDGAGGLQWCGILSISL